MRLEIDDADLLAALNALDDGLTDQSPVMNQLGDYLAGSARDRIENGVDVDGNPFATLAQTTLDRYAKSTPPKVSRSPLWQSGMFRRGLFHDSGPDFVEWGSNAIQAAIMQFGAEKGAFGQTSRGAPIPWGNIPARPFIGVSDDDETAMVALIEEWLESGADDAG
ncbi:phage virion morphogenesis protein [Pseudoroseicyclus sp. H15]